jgi:hypothetical protein
MLDHSREAVELANGTDLPANVTASTTENEENP